MVGVGGKPKKVPQEARVKLDRLMMGRQFHLLVSFLHGDGRCRTIGLITVFNYITSLSRKILVYLLSSLPHKDWDLN